MLLGYDQEGEIKFIFTDEKYLEKMYPKNSAMIKNFWNVKNHGLTEFFISINAFQDWNNHKQYKIIDGKIVKKITEKEDPTKKKTLKSDILNATINQKNNDIVRINSNTIEITSKAPK